MEVSALGARDASDIEPGITGFARGSNGGLIVLGSSVTFAHRDVIIRLAAEHRLPVVYPGRHYITDGGLMSYGPDRVGQYRRAAGYVVRFCGERSRPDEFFLRTRHRRAQVDCRCLCSDLGVIGTGFFTRTPPSAGRTGH